MSCTKCNTSTPCDCTTTNTRATPLVVCDEVVYCTDGCAETIDDACVTTRCGTLDEVIDQLFDADCNAIPGCTSFGTAPVVNICQNEVVNVFQVWTNLNPTITNGAVHPILTPEFVGDTTFTPTIAGQYLFQFAQYEPCYKAQLITLNVEDCVGLCPVPVIIGNSFNSTTNLFDFTLSSPFAEDVNYRIKVSLPDTTVIAEIETTAGDITLITNQVDASNWNNFDQYLSTINFSAANLNAGISFTFDKNQWATDNAATYVSNGVTNATQLIFEISLEKTACPVSTGTTTVNRVVGAMLGSGNAIFNNGAPGFLQNNLQLANLSIAPVFNTDTVSIVTQLPAGAIVTPTTTSTTTTRSHSYGVSALGVSPTVMNQYDLSLTTDLGHTSTIRGFEASGYDFVASHAIDSFTLQEENVADIYNIGIEFLARFQEAHWDETTIQAKTHFNSIGGAAIATGLVLTNAGTGSAANTHTLGAVENTTLGIGSFQLFSQFRCDLTYDDGVGAAVQEETALTFSELELNYIY